MYVYRILFVNVLLAGYLEFRFLGTALKLYVNLNPSNALYIPSNNRASMLYIKPISKLVPYLKCKRLLSRMSESVVNDYEPNTSAWVRSSFIKFFEGKGHLHWPSSSILPNADPTLLFVNAGMNQFKDIIVGKSDKTTEFGRLKRVCNSQKCIRAGGKHNDLDDVGHDCYHNTFFEMLGNWSFGDYFKADAISFAWELLTKVYRLDPDRLYVTYFGGDQKVQSCPPDDEAKELWLRYLPAERILPFGMKDNFWEMADVGPCGPCSEIHYDHVGGRDASRLVNADDPKVVEIWNLVFMQYNRRSGGVFELLPHPCVDTGMGLERLCAILNGSNSNYDCDLFIDITRDINKLLPQLPPYKGSDSKIDIAYRVVSDHVRCLTVAIADGVYPSNDGRGYILRRILRRAVRYATDHLEAKGPFLHLLVDSVAKELGLVYTEIEENKEKIKSVILDEEELFLRTLDKGCERFRKFINKIKDTPNPSISGEEAFLLYSSYGFPLDLTVLMAKEHNITVDTDGFLEESKLHKLKSEKKAVASYDSIEPLLSALFDSLSADKLDLVLKKCGDVTDDSLKYNWNSEGENDQEFTGKVLAIWTLDGLVDEIGEGETCRLNTNCCLLGKAEDTMASSSVFAVITDKTPFYAEGGGQIYDEGFLNQFKVLKVFKMSGLVFHFCSSEQGGYLAVNDEVKLAVDYERRVKVACNHTGTHILNFVLREICNNNSYQRGSQLDAEKLKFDFISSSGLSDDVLEKIETRIQEIIDKDYTVNTKSMPYKDISTIPGIRANFDEKYPEIVRIVSVGSENDGFSTSIEVCGGTHIGKTSTLKDVSVVSEEGISKGVRRITLITHDQSLAAKDRLRDFNLRLDRIVTELRNISNGDLSKLAVDAEFNMKQLTALRALIQDDKLLPTVGKKKLMGRFEPLIDTQMSVIKKNQKRLSGLAKTISAKYITELKAGDYSNCVFKVLGDVCSVRYSLDELDGDVKILNIFVQTLAKSFPDYAIFATSITDSTAACKCVSPNPSVDAIKIANDIAEELKIFPENKNPAKGSSTSAVWSETL